MKVVIAFTVLLLAASGFELAEDITEEEMGSLFQTLATDESVSTELTRGDIEVMGVPNVFVSVHKEYASARVHAKHLKYFKKNVRSGRAGVQLAKRVVRSRKNLICSYLDTRYSDTASTRRLGRVVFCFNRMSLGDGTRIYKHDSSAAAIIFSGYML